MQVRILDEYSNVTWLGVDLEPALELITTESGNKAIYDDAATESGSQYELDILLENERLISNSSKTCLICRAVIHQVRK